MNPPENKKSWLTQLREKAFAAAKAIKNAVVPPPTLQQEAIDQLLGALDPVVSGQPSRTQARRAVLRQAARGATPQLATAIRLRLGGAKFLDPKGHTATMLVQAGDRKWRLPRIEYAKIRWLEANAVSLHKLKGASK